MPARSPHPPQVGIQFRDGGACGKLVSSTSLPSPPRSPVPVMLSRRTPAQRVSPPRFILHLPSEPNASGRREVEAPPPSPRPTVFAAAPSRDARPRPRVSYTCVRVTDTPDRGFRGTLARQTHAGRDQLDASKMNQIMTKVPIKHHFDF